MDQPVTPGRTAPAPRPTPTQKAHKRRVPTAKIPLATQGVDLKGYTLGLDYCHVEARKAPVIDGVVERDAAGMEA